VWNNFKNVMQINRKVFLKSIEEMSELQKELAKLLNGEKRIRQARLEYKDTMKWLEKLAKEIGI
jgi:hypothetical protein